MGIRLVGAALLPDWAHLSDRAHRVLVHMCYVAKDTATNGHAPATYWGGHDVLILTCLGVDPDQLGEAAHDTAARKIKRAIQELKDAGALTLMSPASRGRHAVYRLHLTPWSDDLRPVDNSAPADQLAEERGTRSTPLSGHPAPPIRAERGVLRGQKGGRSAPPRGEHVGEQEELGAIHHPTQPPAQLSPRRDAACG